MYINRGTREGVSVGQSFDVGKLTILRDPNTGELLDQSVEKVGSIQVVTVKEKISICKVTKGGSIATGMSVVFPE